jgi:nucleoside-diphosphate-sugar epimerase
MAMRALITGAAGFVGVHLARALAGRGEDVRCLYRTDASALDGIAVEKISGDVTDPTSLKAAVAGRDVVFHLAGIRRAPQRDAFFRVNAEGTRHVCEAMVAAGARRLVLCSSLAASGPSRPGVPRGEADTLAPAEWYGESKAEAEHIAFSYAGQMEVTAVRPARIVGPGDRENLAFFKVVRRGFSLVIGGPVRAYSFVDVDDVVDLLALTAVRAEAVGEAFFSTGEILTLPQMLDQVAGVLGIRTRQLYVPEWLLSALAAGADVFSSLSGRHLPLNRKLARQLLAPSWTCSGEKAKRMLGHVPSRSVADSIRRTAKWYQQEGWL